MSYKTETLAKSAAEKVKAILHFGNWKVIVHENLGWHCSLRWEFFSLSIEPEGERGNRFMLLIGPGGCGISSLSVIHGNDANEIISKAPSLALKELLYYTKVADWLKTVQNGIKPTGNRAAARKRVSRKDGAV